MISSGRVLVNGKTAELGAKVEPEDEVSLDGRPVKLPISYAYLAMNKPAGYLTTMSDDFGRKTIAHLMPNGIPGLVPVGRLDIATTGLILLTNDGDFANFIAHPSSEIEKEYELTVADPIPEGAIEALARGPVLDDGPMLPPRLHFPESHEKTRKRGSTLKFRATIHEGRNRIIRRACETVGLELVALRRVRVGSVALGRLPKGEVRELTPRELDTLPGGTR